MNQILKQYNKYNRRRKQSIKYYLWKFIPIGFAVVVMICAILYSFCLKRNSFWKDFCFWFEVCGTAMLFIIERPVLRQLRIINEDNARERYSDLYENFEPIKNNTPSDILQVRTFFSREIEREQKDLDCQTSWNQIILSSVIFAAIINAHATIFASIGNCLVVYWCWKTLTELAQFSQTRRIQHIQRLVADLDGVLDIMLQSNAISSSPNPKKPQIAWLMCKKKKGRIYYVTRCNLHFDKSCISSSRKDRICRRYRK